ncbi:MAG: hypothetical protein H7122_09305 [Chitinophagaceae bacterium]|nr:hypothetical protein [Chitinophagaceae bacterium]
MNMYQFNCLDEVRQIELLWSAGVLVGSRQEGHYKILLYQIEGFYVEVFYQYFQGKMVKTKSFSDTNQLEPYLDSINIGSLLSHE